MAISDQLTLLANTKESIRTSINNKGGSVGASDTFASYATAIDNLPSGGSGNPLLRSIDVSDFTGTTFNKATNYITDVTIPSGVTSIANNAIEYCYGITSIDIPNSLTSIGNYAFRSCTGLTTITLPANLTSIGYSAFTGTTNLQSIIFLATTPPTLDAEVFTNGSGCPIYVPAASVETYKTASTRWSSYSSRIYPIQQVATVDGNPVYNYDLGMTSTTMITSTNMQKMPTGTSLELAEGIVDAGGSFGNYTSITLPSTFSSFDDQGTIGNTTTTLTCLATTPPTAERNNLGGANLTAIYVPAASVSDYQANAAWSSFSSIIQAISA